MNWFSRLKEGLKNTSSRIGSGIAGIVTRRKLDDETINELEELLISADFGVEAAGRIMESVRKTRFGKEITEEELKEALAVEIEALLAPVAKPLAVTEGPDLQVIMMVGVNGNGKTTSIGKIAHNFIQLGHKTALAACDTFRAAAVEQLAVWGKRAGAEFYSGAEGADPASVCYQAIEKSRAGGVKVLLVDTAGRLQNKSNLMVELAKITAVCGKIAPGAPHNVVLVLDGTTGQNAISQVENFKKIANVTGLVITKLDGTAKGGIVVALAGKFGLPVHAVGVGEGIDDLRPFEAGEFARSLVE